MNRLLTFFPFRKYRLLFIDYYKLLLKPKLAALTWNLMQTLVAMDFFVFFFFFLPSLWLGKNTLLQRSSAFLLYYIV